MGQTITEKTFAAHLRHTRTPGHTARAGAALAVG